MTLTPIMIRHMVRDAREAMAKQPGWITLTFNPEQLTLIIQLLTKAADRAENAMAHLRCIQGKADSPRIPTCEHDPCDRPGQFQVEGKNLCWRHAEQHAFVTRIANRAAQ